MIYNIFINNIKNSGVRIDAASSLGNQNLNSYPEAINLLCKSLLNDKNK